MFFIRMMRLRLARSTIRCRRSEASCQRIGRKMKGKSRRRGRRSIKMRRTTSRLVTVRCDLHFTIDFKNDQVL